MQVQKCSQNFGFRFKLSSESIKAAEKATGLTYQEMTSLSLQECENLMIKRGTLKKPNKLKIWLATQYRKIGESLGLLQKEYNIYTDID